MKTPLTLTLALVSFLSLGACSPSPPPPAPSPSVKLTPLKPVASPKPPPPTAPAVVKPKVAPGQKVVYLTFDDGPHPTWTPQVLEVLRREQVPATFFQLGPAAQAHPQVSKALRQAGMSVQVHGWEHKDYSKRSQPWVRSDLAQAKKAIAQATGVTPTCSRPPYGATNRLVRAALASQGLEQVLWNVDSEDWTHPGPRTMTATVMAEVKPGSTILLHDGGGERAQTLQALPLIIKSLRAKGYSFGLRCPA